MASGTLTPTRNFLFTRHTKHEVVHFGPEKLLEIFCACEKAVQDGESGRALINQLFDLQMTKRMESSNDGSVCYHETCSRDCMHLQQPET